MLHQQTPEAELSASRKLFALWSDTRGSRHEARVSRCPGEHKDKHLVSEVRKWYLDKENIVLPQEQ